MRVKLHMEAVKIAEKSKDRVFETVITSVAVCLALFFYLLGWSGILPVIVVFFGALWNFFTEVNHFLACIFGFVVCVTYALVAASFALFGHAALHLFFYLPMQLFVFYNSRNTDVGIKREKRVSPIMWVFIAVVFVLTVVFGWIVLAKLKGTVPFLDVFSVAALTVSVFLVTAGFREYYLWRVFAVSLAAIVWVYIGVVNGFYDGVVQMIILFAMYGLVDGCRGMQFLLQEGNKK